MDSPMFKMKDDPMGASRITCKRVEPVLKSLANARDEASDTMAWPAARSEPPWICESASDVAADISSSNRGSMDSCPAQPRNAVEYRVLDWLSAIALLMASAAIALTLNRQLF
jgi:hypothetical protein